MKHTLLSFAVSMLLLSQFSHAVSQTQETTVTFQYDANGNLIERRDGLGHPIVSEYDLLGRLTATVDAKGQSTRYAYDQLDRLIRVTDPRNLVTSYTKNGFGEDIVIANPGATDIVQTFDASGNILSITDANGQKTSFEYDLLDRQVKTTYPDLSSVVYEYDKGVNGTGHLTRVENAYSRILYSYNISGQITRDARMIAGVEYVTEYGYDDFGSLVSIVYPSGRLVTYTRDNGGRIAAIQTSRSGEIVPLIASVVYEPFSGVKSFSFGNGQAYSRKYDLDGRISEYSSNGKIQKISYDAVGRITSIAENGNPQRTFALGYDELDRLTNFGAPTLSLAYTYDADGNRTRKFSGSSDTGYGYSSTSNKLLEIARPQIATITSDKNGSIVNDGARSFTYNAAERLVAADSGIGATTYRHNGLGQRIIKSRADVATIFHYDIDGKLIAESKGGVFVEYFYLDNIPVAVLK